MPNSRQFFRSVSICCLAIGSAIGSAAVGGRHVVVGVATVRSGRRTLRPGQPQALERLGAGHFVDQVQVDVEDRLFAGFRMDDMVVQIFEEVRGRGLEFMMLIG